MADFYHMDQPFIQRVMNQHEIDRAIRQAKGPRDFDPSIKKIWDRLLKKPTRRRETKKQNSRSFYDVYNRGFRDGIRAILKVVELAAGNSCSETAKEVLPSPRSTGWKEKASPEAYML
ncbi:MAG: hypothetical protein JXD22_14900 [Sedimentisphaerales bacterium]|nr:hypothetical protein [Sedimentisphaerales bacterium]